MEEVMKPAHTAMQRRRERPSRNRGSRCAIALLVLAFAGVALPAETRAQTITEFPLPNHAASPMDIVAGPDGNLWFVEMVGNRIGRITPHGVITEFAIPTADSSPVSITAGADGHLWFVEANGNKIGRITTGGVVTDEFTIPTPKAYPGSITAGPDGSLWFTEAARIGRISMAGSITEYPLPSSGSLAGITAGPDGNVWFTDYYGDKIGRITMSGDITIFSVPFDSWPSGITAGPDGNLWFARVSGGGIGRMTTSGVSTDFNPTAVIAPREITAGTDGNLWFTWITGGVSNGIGHVTTSGVFTLLSTPTPNAGPAGITTGPDGNIWFTEASAGKIGRIELGAAGPCVPGPTTLCLSDGRFRVETAWRVPREDTSGLGTAVALTADTGYFWFFDAENLEVVVKVLNGCVVNGHQWVFAAGLTNVDVTITVMDTTTSESRTYQSFAGAPFPPIQDTAAFACP